MPGSLISSLIRSRWQGKRSHEKKLATVTAHRELTVISPWPKWSQPAVTEPWPGPWLSCDLAVIEPWSYWICRDWAVTSPWLSCDLALTELWPSRDWAVTSPSRDWAVIFGPRSRDHRGHREPTVSSPWDHGDHLFSRGFPAFAAHAQTAILRVW